MMGTCIMNGKRTGSSQSCQIKYVALFLKKYKKKLNRDSICMRGIYLVLLYVKNTSYKRDGMAGNQRFVYTTAVAVGCVVVQQSFSDLYPCCYLRPPFVSPSYLVWYSSSPNSHSGSHSRLFSPLSTTVRALHFYRVSREELSPSFLVESRRIAPTNPRKAALSSWSFLYFCK